MCLGFTCGAMFLSDLSFYCWAIFHYMNRSRISFQLPVKRLTCFHFGLLWVKPLLIILNEKKLQCIKSSCKLPLFFEVSMITPFCIRKEVFVIPPIQEVKVLGPHLRAMWWPYPSWLLRYPDHRTKYHYFCITLPIGCGVLLMDFLSKSKCTGGPWPQEQPVFSPMP